MQHAIPHARRGDDDHSKYADRNPQMVQRAALLRTPRLIVRGEVMATDSTSMEGSAA
jgi:hypothetical protein